MASSEQALRNTSTEAIKTEICLSAASSFPFSRRAGVLACAGARLDFSFCELFLFIKEKKKWKKARATKKSYQQRIVIKTKFEKTKH